MSLSVGDAQSFNKKISDKGNMNICPRTKQYNEKIGGVLAGALIAILAFIVFFNKISDFLLPDIRPERKGHQSGMNNNFNNHNRNDLRRRQLKIEKY